MLSDMISDLDGSRAEESSHQVGKDSSGTLSDSTRDGRGRWQEMAACYMQYDPGADLE